MIPIKYNVRSLLVRKATTVATALGIALVVFVLTSSLMLSAGIQKTMSTAGRSDVGIVLRKGSEAELGSSVEDPQVGLVKAMPGVKKEGTTPIGSGESVVVAAMEKIGASGVTNVSIRGMTEDGRKLRTNTVVVAGRAPAPGADEVMVGARIRGRIRGLELGESFELKKNRAVKVVGIFEDAGSASESEVWCDLDVLRTSFGREGSVSSVRVQLESPASFDAFQAAVESDKRIGLMAMREDKFFEKQSEGLSIFIGALGSLIAFFFSVGAMIGAAITMYASVANRQREIGTLRALGFSRFSILFCFVAESTLLATVGGVVGVIAAMGMGMVKFSMMNFSSWSEMVFSFEPTPPILIGAMIFAVGMGLIGGFLPALRAARISPLAAMRG